MIEGTCHDRFTSARLPRRSGQHVVTAPAFPRAGPDGQPHRRRPRIGGGITGVGVALDAATRGLDVALVESNDLAFGTSRWSSKLVHGGLRYLAQGQVGVAYESAVERERLMAAIAPHLTHPLAQVLPVIHGCTPTGAGRTARRRRPASRHGQHPRPAAAARQPEALTLAPGMIDGLTAPGCRDGQLIDDARLVVAVAYRGRLWSPHPHPHRGTGHRRAQRRGSGAQQVRVADSLTGERWTISARRVVNATGAWAAELDDRVELIRLRGSHLVVSAKSLGNPTGALMVPVEGSTSRFVFALPEAEGLAYIGLTDVETEDPLDSPPRARRRSTSCCTPSTGDCDRH